MRLAAQKSQKVAGPRRRRHAAARSRLVAGALSVAAFLGLGTAMAANSQVQATATTGGSNTSSSGSSTSGSSQSSQGNQSATPGSSSSGPITSITHGS
jgi:hypothetical protein